MQQREQGFACSEVIFYIGCSLGQKGEKGSIIYFFLIKRGFFKKNMPVFLN